MCDMQITVIGHKYGAHRKHLSQHLTLEPSLPQKGTTEQKLAKDMRKRREMPEKQRGQARAEKGEKRALSEPHSAPHL